MNLRRKEKRNKTRYLVVVDPMDLLTEYRIRIRRARQKRRQEKLIPAGYPRTKKLSLNSRYVPLHYDLREN